MTHDWDAGPPASATEKWLQPDRPLTRGDWDQNDSRSRAKAGARSARRTAKVVAIGVAALLGASAFMGAVSSPSTPDPSPVVAAAASSPRPAPSRDGSVEPTTGATPTTTPTVPVTPTPTTAPTPSRTPVVSPTPTPTPPPTPSPSPTPTPTPPPLGSAPIGPTETATVLRVIDGDTIEVDRGFGPEKVRYIGIDTPETVHPSEPVEWMGAEASAANRRLVEGRDVVLESDVSDVDQYGRLLRYVWTQEPGGWIFVNLALVTKGFAQVSTYPPDVRYVDLYLERQEIARQNEAGLWGTPPPTPAPQPEPVDPVVPLAGNCDASYPGVCIPPAPPDLDCGQIDHRRFEVIGSDPHGFDGNGDGVGCESG